MLRLSDELLSVGRRPEGMASCDQCGTGRFLHPVDLIAECRVSYAEGPRCCSKARLAGQLDEMAKSLKAILRCADGLHVRR